MHFTLSTEMEINIFNTDKKYDIIYTDPPWIQGKGGKRKLDRIRAVGI